MFTLRAQLESKHQQLDASIVAQNETLASLDKLRDIIEKTRLVLNCQFGAAIYFSATATGRAIFKAGGLPIQLFNY